MRGAWVIPRDGDCFFCLLALISSSSSQFIIVYDRCGCVLRNTWHLEDRLC